MRFELLGTGIRGGPFLVIAVDAGANIVLGTEDGAHFKPGGFLKRLQRGIVERTQHRDRQYVPKTVDGDHLIGLGEFAGHEHYQLGSISN